MIHLTREEVIQHWRDECTRLDTVLQALGKLPQLPMRLNGWTADQEVDHLIRSTGPVTLSLWLPGFVLRLMFGRSQTGVSRSYDEVVALYQEVLRNGGKAKGAYIPQKHPDWQQLCKKWQSTAVSFERRLAATSFDTLDRLMLPHPLLGKFTQRELIYFTLYHTGHHRKNLEELLAKAKPDAGK
jgi:hypothetical protein